MYLYQSTLFIRLMILNQVKPGHAVTFMKSLTNEIKFIVYIVYKISLIDLTESSGAGNK